MDFKYGDLVIKCHQCGEIQEIEHLVTDGRCIYLFNKDDSYIKLHCPKCDITMEMCIMPNAEANTAAEDIVELEETSFSEVLDESTDENYSDEELSEKVIEEEII